MAEPQELEPKPNPWDMSLITLPKMELGPTDTNKNEDALPKSTQGELAEKLIFPDPRAYRIDSFAVPGNCPPGLEALWASNTSLVVLRRPENAIHLIPEQRLLAFSQYDIVNDKGRQMYVALEQTTRKALYWKRDARQFEVTMFDRDSNKILTIKRPWACFFCFAQYYCCCCMFSFKGCGNKAIVTLCEGNKQLGTIVQACSHNRTVLEIHDEYKRHVLTIAGEIEDGLFDVFLSNDENDNPVAMIETCMTPQEVSAFYKIKVSNFEDPYGVTFFTRYTPTKHKALIIAAIILMDFIFCKPNTDYPHWTQFIPADFKPEADTREKVFRDGSKEIIVTSMQPRFSRKNAQREERKCGCCRWFFAFICLCCPLGYTRNALRCIQLIVFGFILISLAIAAIIYHVLK